MNLRTMVCMLSAIVLTTPVPAQSPPANQAFEVTSIKPNNSCGGPGRGGGGLTQPGRITLECAELRDLILTAYAIYGNGANPGPRAFRIKVLGGPAWVDSDRYDIAAKAQGNPARSQMYGTMLRALLEERFQLKVHRETRQVPVYFLTVAKGGAKMTVAKPGSCISTDINHPAPQPAAGQQAPRVCGSQTTGTAGTTGTFDMVDATMADFSTQLALRVDRDVIDKTGLTGTFDIHLEAARAELLPRHVAGGEVRGIEPSTPSLRRTLPAHRSSLLCNSSLG